MNMFFFSSSDDCLVYVTSSVKTFTSQIYFDKFFVSCVIGMFLENFLLYEKGKFIAIASAASERSVLHNRECLKAWGKKTDGRKLGKARMLAIP